MFAGGRPISARGARFAEAEYLARRAERGRGYLAAAAQRGGRTAPARPSLARKRLAEELATLAAELAELAELAERRSGVGKRSGPRRI
jgi:hypothetical protein